MDFIKFILICLGIVFILDACLDQPTKRPLTIQDCISTNGNVNVGCIQEVNTHYGY